MRQGGLSYEDVGEALGVTEQTVREWEKLGLPKMASIAFKAVFRTGKVFREPRGLIIG